MEGPRGARIEELEEIIRLSNKIFRSNMEGDMGREYPLLFSEKNCENLRIIKEDNKIVSLVGILFSDVILIGIKIKVCMIGSVATDPDYRGRGFASLLMQDSIVKSLQEGVDIMLISGGRGLYRRLGAINAGLYKTYHIDKAKLSRGDLKVKRVNEGDIYKLLRLMELEPVRFVRSYEELKTILGCSMVVNRPGEVLVVEKNNSTPLAYMAIQLPKMQNEVLRIKEIGGSRSALLDSLYAVLETYNRDSLILDTLSSDTEIRYILEKLGIKGEDRGFEGTIKIINPKSLIKKLESYFRRMLGEEYSDFVIEFNPPITIRFRDEKIQIDENDLPALIFGSIEKKIEIPEQLTQIKRVLDILFPIPLVDYGLNYT
ncbi:MAG: GNAT family N-acetyltransferase [bacterium]|nr:GNAT family N-acetyltransferase [bacterium]